MNYRSKIFILSGIYALLAIFLSKKLFFSYYYGENGVNLLPIAFFEYLIFSIALITFIITLITISVLVKRNTYPLTFKKRFNFLIPAFMAWIILFLMLRENLGEFIVPVSIAIYGLILLNLNRFVTSRLVYFGSLLIVLGLLSLIFPSHTWLALVLGFGALPILFGLILLRTSGRKTVER